MMLKPGFLLLILVVGPTFAAGFNMLGGFQSVGGAENDATVQKAADFAVGELSSKTGSSLSLSKVLSAEKQVVAGTNYKMKLQTSGGIYDVTVYESLPHAGGKMELSKYEKAAGGESCGGGMDADTQQAAEFAARHISQTSNSLIPLELKQVLESSKEGNTHKLKIKVGRQNIDDSTWEVEVEQGDAANQYRVASFAQL